MKVSHSLKAVDELSTKGLFLSIVRAKLKSEAHRNFTDGDFMVCGYGDEVTLEVDSQRDQRERARG